MRKSSLLILVAALAVVGASCGKNNTKNNTNTMTNATNVSNTTTNIGTTTGTFETNTNSGSDTNTSPVNTNPVATNANTAQAATLTITSDGISPKTLIVTSGTTVTIINNDSRSHEITSNPHPDHTDLPGFEKQISAGSSTSFTFTQTGSWGYHDHDDPFDSKWQGTVIVQ